MSIGALPLPPGTAPATRDGEPPQPPTARSPLQNRIIDIYDTLVMQYDEALAEASPDPGATRSAYPSLDVESGEETVEVTFDVTLYEQLFMLYAVDGWAAIDGVERALAGRAPRPDAETPPGGTADRTAWTAAYRFFRGVATLLTLLIREALATLEQRAVAVLVPALNRYADAYDQAWDAELRMDTEIMKLAGDQGVRSRYVIRNTARGALLHAELVRAVRIREEMAGLKGLYDRQTAAKASTAGSANLAAQLAELQADLARQVTQIQRNLPLILVAYPGMRPDSTVGDLAQLIGAAVGGTGPQARSLAKAVGGAARSMSLLRHAVSAEGGGLDRSELARWDAGGPEAAVVAAARRTQPKDNGCTPLLMERLWHLLPQAGVIPPGSFERIVHHWYVMALIDDKERRAEAVGSASTTLIRAGALLSLTVLAGVTFGLAALPALRAASEVINLILVGDAVYGAMEGLDETSLLLADQYAAPDALTMRGLAAVAEICSYQADIVNRLGVELAMTAAGYGLGLAPPPRLVQKGLLTWLFWQDLRTLVDP